MRKVLCITLAVLSIVACKRENLGGDAMITLNLSGKISATKASGNSFEDGDKMGVYVVDYNGSTAGTLQNSGNRADNVGHTLNASTGKWNADKTIYFKDKNTNVDIYGYYPYTAIANASAYKFSITQDQSVEGYEASDFLWAKAANIAPTSETISLTFNHIMSGLKITLQEGSGFDSGEWDIASKSVVVKNAKLNASIDLATGTPSVTGEVSPTGVIPMEDEGIYRAVIVPQTISAGTALIAVSVDGYSYYMKKSEDFIYESGKVYTFTLTVNKSQSSGTYEIVLDNEGIAPWTEDSTEYLATARSYTIINVSEPGSLEEAIANAGQDISKLKRMKLTGKINTKDFAVMKYSMPQLSALNLKEVEIVAGKEGSLQDEQPYYANEALCIPEYALTNKTSLVTIIFPDQLTEIEQHAFEGCENLSGSINLPEGLTYIGRAAFHDCGSLNGSLSLPSTLKNIGSLETGSGGADGAFSGCGFNCELQLPDGLESIGTGTFYYCQSLHGTLHLPEGLKEMGACAFDGCKGLTGPLVVPEGVTKIPECCFSSAGFNGKLVLGSQVASIGANAFYETPLKGELNLPKGLEVIGRAAFSSCSFSGVLTLPESLIALGDFSFQHNYYLSGTLEFPDNLYSIGQYAFYDCPGIEGISLPADLEAIGQGAFEGCYSIGRIVCKGSTPPYVNKSAFEGIAKDNFAVEVPSSAIAQYKTATGWCDFKRIAAFCNFYCSPSSASAINAGASRDIVLYADTDWTLMHKPEWVSLNTESGSAKTQISICFLEMSALVGSRKDSLVFSSMDGEYTTVVPLSQYNYAYSEDAIITLQSATTGSGVNLVFLADGYSAEEISDGTMVDNIKEAVGYFFDIEPYKSYKEYFNVYMGIAVSPESGVGGLNTIIYNKFNTSAKSNGTIGGRNGDSDFEAIFEYAKKAPTVDDSNIGETLIVMVLNTDNYSGKTYLFDDGSAISYCPKTDYGYPYDFRGTIQHEAGGHGFGKLADESIRHNEFIDACSCTCCGHVQEILDGKAKGWYQNISLSGKASEVPWTNMLYHDNYKDYVDIYEGAFSHSRGVYRSEANSCMNNSVPYYNAISRKAIVQRIMMLSGGSFNFNDFASKDKTDSL